MSFVLKALSIGVATALGIWADEPLTVNLQGQSAETLAVGVQGGPVLHRLQSADAVSGVDWSVNENLTSQTNFVVTKKEKSKFVRAQSAPPNDVNIFTNALSLVDRGRETFRYDTFGSESFWGESLKLHQAIAGTNNGGVGPGVSPKTALAVGLKVDSEALPESVKQAIAHGDVNLDDPATTLTLLQLDSVIGVKGIFDANRKLVSLGIQCALCHSTVDDSFAAGIGRRLDGWPNRDLNVGAIVNLSPDVSALTNALAVDEGTVRTVLQSWGPGKFDAELILDGKAFRPDGKSAATLLPAAFGLAGVNLHTYTGWGSVTHWNAFVSNLEMHGSGTFWDPRLNDTNTFPLAAKNGYANVRPATDLVTSKLGALQFYQLSIPAPKAPATNYNAEAAVRGGVLFNTKAQCATCHVPPIYTEPGWNMHTPEEIGIDAFQANRSPDKRYRTTPLGGLFARAKGGFYHDGRFATLEEVVRHYDSHFGLSLTQQEVQDLVEFLKSI